MINQRVLTILSIGVVAFLGGCSEPAKGDSSASSTASQPKPSASASPLISPSETINPTSTEVRRVRGLEIRVPVSYSTEQLSDRTSGLFNGEGGGVEVMDLVGGYPLKDHVEQWVSKARETGDPVVLSYENVTWPGADDAFVLYQTRPYTKDGQLHTHYYRSLYLAKGDRHWVVSAIERDNPKSPVFSLIDSVRIIHQDGENFTNE